MVFFFTVDFDTNSYIAEAKKLPDDEPEQEKETPEYISTDIVFISGKNSQESVLQGKIRFAISPDGTKEFGLLVLMDPSTNEFYTLFLNPYFSSVEILEGAVDFNEKYPI